MIDILYAISVLILLFFGISLMANGWGLMSMSERENTEEYEHYNNPELKKAVEESTHPEMQNLLEGEQLLSVSFVKEDPPGEKEYEDPLNKSLQERIDALREENKKDEEDDDDEDDGGELVGLSR